MEEALFKVAIQQPKVPVGVDPKSVVCEFFKKGLCVKGDKCKYSHDLEQGRKADKIDIYTDRRNATEEELEKDTMDTWDQAKLEQVVKSKENKGTTKIVCKYFLDAIESKKYGWFWICPNGGEKCQYQHCLPPGFELKSKKAEEIPEEDKLTIEEEIEEERAKLMTRTPITLESFLKWKQDKKKEREEKLVAVRAQRESDIKSGKVMRSGREMFIFNPDLFVDDDNVVDVDELEPEKDEGLVINIEVSGTSISTRITNTDENGENSEQNSDDEQHSENEEENTENGKEEVEHENGKEEAKDIQENLFTEEEIPDEED